MTQEQFDNLKPGDRISHAVFLGFYTVARRDDASSPRKHFPTCYKVKEDGSGMTCLASNPVCWELVEPAPEVTPEQEGVCITVPGRGTWFATPTEATAPAAVLDTLSGITAAEGQPDDRAKEIECLRGEAAEWKLTAERRGEAIRELRQRLERTQTLLEDERRAHEATQRNLTVAEKLHDAAEGQRDKARRIAKELRDAIVRPQSHPLPWK